MIDGKISSAARKPRFAAVTWVTSPRWLLLVAVVLLYCVFFLLPLLDVVLRSLDPQGLVSYSNLRFSLEHYWSVFANPVLRQLLAQTFKIAGLTALACAILAFPTAYLMSRLTKPTAMLLLTLILASFFVSVVVRLFALVVILGRNGVINSLLDFLGFGGPYGLLFTTGATILGMVNYLLPFMIIMLYAAMTDIDSSLTTAAKTLGASDGQAFRRIFLPLVWPALVSGMLLVFVLSLGFFLTPAVLGSPQNTTIPVYMHKQVSVLQWGSASATGVILLIVTVIGYVLAFRAGGGSIVPERRVGGSRGEVERERLRSSLSTVLLWAATVISLVILLLPLAIVVPASFDTAVYLGFPPRGITIRWYVDVLTDPVWGRAVSKSLIVAVGTGILGTVIGLVLARHVQGLRSRWARNIVQSAIFAPLAAPVIVLAIGIYDIQISLDLIGTVSGLVLAHAIISFPLAFAILNNALASVNPSLEAAAWTMGASRTYAFWRVVLPNLVPSLVGAFLVCFIISWDEAVIALFQTGFEKTLPVTIFSFVVSGATPAVAAVASMLVALVIVALVGAVVIRRIRRWRQTKSGAALLEAGTGWGRPVLQAGHE